MRFWVLEVRFWVLEVRFWPRPGTELWAVTIREEKGRFWRPVRDAFLREASPGRLPQDVFRLPRGLQEHIPY